MSRLQKLGIVVLVFAAFGFSGIVSGLVYAAHHSFDGSVLVDAAFWTSLVAGGVGMARSRPWGRWLAICGLLGPIIAAILSVLGDVVRTGSASGAANSLLSVGLFFLPGAVLLIVIVSVRPTSSPPKTGVPQRVTGESRWSVVDTAYACFAWIAFVILAAALVSMAPIEFSTGQALGMVVGIPAAMLSLVALGVGGVLSVIRLREWPLPLMTLAALSMIAVFVAYEETDLVGQDLFNAWSVVGTGTLAVFSIRWAVSVRRRRKSLEV